jgi:hypothetical protein
VEDYNYRREKLGLSGWLSTGKIRKKPSRERDQIIHQGQIKKTQKLV